MCWQDGFGVGKAKNSWETTDLATTFPLDQNHTITRQDGEPFENGSNLINLCCLWLSKCFHLFNFHLSGLLLQLWPKEKCVLHPHGLSFTSRFSPLPLIGPSSKITRVFCSVSCYNLLPLGWPRYTVADSGRAWCGRRTRCWSATASPSQMVGHRFCRINNFHERLMYRPAKLSRWL